MIFDHEGVILGLDQLGRLLIAHKHPRLPDVCTLEEFANGHKPILCYAGPRDAVLRRAKLELARNRPYDAQNYNGRHFISIVTDGLAVRREFLRLAPLNFRGNDVVFTAG